MRTSTSPDSSRGFCKRLLVFSVLGRAEPVSRAPAWVLSPVENVNAQPGHVVAVVFRLPALVACSFLTRFIHRIDAVFLFGGFGLAYLCRRNAGRPRGGRALYGGRAFFSRFPTAPPYFSLPDFQTAKVRVSASCRHEALSLGRQATKYSASSRSWGDIRPARQSPPRRP